MSTGPASSTFCSRCKLPLPLEIFNTFGKESCSGCGASLYAFAFPALIRPVERGRGGEELLVDGEASCFFHQQKKAVVACGHCGRFLCSLCDIEFNGDHLCSTCIESGKKKGKWKNLEDKRVLYDDMALALAILPLLIFYVSFITAPIALFIAIRYWNAPRSIIPRTKIRFVLASLFSVAQIAGWIALLYFLISGSLD